VFLADVTFAAVAILSTLSNVSKTAERKRRESNFTGCFAAKIYKMLAKREKNDEIDIVKCSHDFV
jgi:hypothetical protein